MGYTIIHVFVYIPVFVDALSLDYMLSVICVYKTRRVVFPLALVRAASTVPGHSGAPAIEADLREGEPGDAEKGTGRRGRRVWT